MEVILSGDIPVIHTGYTQIDALNTAVFQEELRDTIAANRKVVINFSSVRFIDSSGLGNILAIYREISLKGGKMVLCSANSAVSTLFDMVKLSQIIPCFSTEEEAVSYLKVD